jgi:hypothetical protein
VEVGQELLQTQVAQPVLRQVLAPCFKAETVDLAPQELDWVAQMQLFLEQVVVVEEDFLLLQQLGLWAQVAELNLELG